MFANYNLMLHLPLFLLPLLAKYTSRKFTLYCIVCGGLGLMSVYFITEPTVFTMEWLPMIGVGIAWASIFLFPMPCYQAHCHLTKWAITWEFSTSLS
jgi:maltose/moltooligosaccharide transporter